MRYRYATPLTQMMPGLHDKAGSTSRETHAFPASSSNRLDECLRYQTCLIYRLSNYQDSPCMHGCCHRNLHTECLSQAFIELTRRALVERAVCWILLKLTTARVAYTAYEWLTVAMSNGYLRDQIMAENTVGHFTRRLLNFK